MPAQAMAEQETQERDFAAVDVLGRNTLSDESAADALEQFWMFLKG